MTRFGLDRGWREVRRSFVLRGRSTRADALACAAWVFAAVLGVAFVAAIAFAHDLLTPPIGDALDWAVALGPTIPFLGVLARRLNDQDRSRWWLLAWALLLCTLAMQEWMEEGWRPLDLNRSLAEGMVKILALPFAVLLCSPGTIGPNRHGPDPREPVPEPS